MWFLIPEISMWTDRHDIHHSTLLIKGLKAKNLNIILLTAVIASIYCSIQMKLVVSLL